MNVFSALSATGLGPPVIPPPFFLAVIPMVPVPPATIVQEPEQRSSKGGPAGVPAQPDQATQPTEATHAPKGVAGQDHVGDVGPVHLHPELGRAVGARLPPPGLKVTAGPHVVGQLLQGDRALFVGVIERSVAATEHPLDPAPPRLAFHWHLLTIHKLHVA
jgi:hypothetical protein